ncbi:MAG: cytochrome c biogenesis protein ResB, partial [Planctomycetes bacterium]|nr:cytochrome c biogenesis protein ResB [Planctomycetota bacterium]
MPSVLPSPLLVRPEVVAAEAMKARLPSPRPGRLGAALSLALAFAILDLVLLVVLPWSRHQRSAQASPWTDPTQIQALVFLGAFGVLCGLLATARARRRGRSPWWFLAGHSGAFLAPFVVPGGMFGFSLGTAVGVATLASVAGVGLVPRRALEATLPPDRLLDGLRRVLFLSGDIRVGITIMCSLAMALFWGTWWESWYGARSAQHLFYGSLWFGTLLGLLGLALITATLRKLPWRLDQTGWIVVHASLVLALIGGFVTLQGKVEGELGLGEGQVDGQFLEQGTGQLELYIRGARRGRLPRTPLWVANADFAADPSEREPEHRFAVSDHTRVLFNLVVDRYYSDARPSASDAGDYEPASYKDGLSVARCRLEGESVEAGAGFWLVLGQEPVTINASGRVFELAWKRRSVPLGFQIRLDDFRRDFYPGSTQERSFESQVTLFDGGGTHGESRLIDMNHPLRHAGWRLYQSRFSTRGGDRTFLMVNRDPGLALIWPACGLLGLGLVIVFFQKPFLRAVAEYLKAGRRRPRATLISAISVV